VSAASEHSAAPRVEAPRANRRSLYVFSASAAIGILADWLLRVTPWGVNAAICILAFAAAAVLLVRRHRAVIGPDGPALALTGSLLAIAFLRRASEWLGFFDLVALTLVAAMALRSAEGFRIKALGLSHHVRAIADTIRCAITGGLALVFRDVAWRESLGSGRLGRIRSVLLGLVLALPVVVLLGALLSSADTVFATILDNLIAIQPDAALQHVLFWAACTLLAAGYLNALVGGGSASRRPLVAAQQAPALGITVVATMLTLVNLLFLLFVVVQIRYLFGGQAIVLETTGLTLAEYARSGFFELVTVSSLSLSLLLGADWVLHGESAAGRRLFRQLAGVSLGLLLIMTASALERMRIYVTEFGLSEIRLFATAFMIYLAILFAWFAWTVLRGRRRRFAFGGVTLGFAMLAALHVLNPDAVIARANLDRAVDGYRFDPGYVTRTLSADAVPVVLSRVSALEPPHRCVVAEVLLDRWAGDRASDWRSWNWSRARARRMVTAHSRELNAMLASGCDSGRRSPRASAGN
jgi:hypothetical protein